MNTEKTSTGLTKERIEECLEQDIANDYHRFDYICSGVTVINFERIENSLIVEYSFWDDGHADSFNQSYFLFDVEVGQEYGVNFPSSMQYIKFKSKLTWESAVELENLSANFYEELIGCADITTYNWGEKEINDWIEHFIDNDPKHLALMLIEHYHADIKLPDFIPIALAPHFKKLISENLTK